jgi:hypothetical protein
MVMVVNNPTYWTILAACFFRVSLQKRSSITNLGVAAKIATYKDENVTQLRKWPLNQRIHHVNRVGLRHATKRSG